MNSKGIVSGTLAKIVIVVLVIALVGILVFRADILARLDIIPDFNESQSDGGVSGTSGGNENTRECVLATAKWSKDKVRGGEVVDLTVSGIDCDGEFIEFQIFEDDNTPKADPLVFLGSDIKIENGVAFTTWTAVYEAEELYKFFNRDPEYYFIGRLKDGKEIKSGLLEVRK